MEIAESFSSVFDKAPCVLIKSQCEIHEQNQGASFTNLKLVNDGEEIFLLDNKLDKIKYVNRIINYFAASTLAIYILTDNAFVRIPLDTWLFDGIMNGGIGYVYVFVAALVCLLIDKIRELLFSIIIKLYNGIKTK